MSPARNLTEQERGQLVLDVRAETDEIPPPPPPPPLISSGAATIAGIGAGLIDGVVISGLSSSQPGFMDGLAKSPLLWWIVMGGIVGGILGGVGSLIYNIILRNSSDVRALKRRYPEAGTNDPAGLTIYWFEVKLARLYRHMHDTFQKIEQPRTAPTPQGVGTPGQEHPRKSR